VINIQETSHRAAEFIAADPLNDGFPQTSQLAAGFFISRTAAFGRKRLYASLKFTAGE